MSNTGLGPETDVKQPHVRNLETPHFGVLWIMQDGQVSTRVISFRSTHRELRSLGQYYILLEVESMNGSVNAINDWKFDNFDVSHLPNSQPQAAQVRDQSLLK